MNLKARLLGGWIGDKLLRDLVVDDVRDVAPRFRGITLSGRALVNGSFRAGDKVQIYLPAVGARTYTPFGFDGQVGRFELLAYLHGDGPGASWARGLERGHAVRVFGPRSSLDLPDDARPVSLFGDETSFAVARALQESRTASPPFIRLEVSDLEAASEAARALALPPKCLVARTAERAHLRRVAGELLEGATERALVLTGDAHAIQELRSHLRQSGVRSLQKVRAYWATGKRGLD